LKRWFYCYRALNYLLLSDAQQAFSKSLALAVIAGADCLNRLKPDLLLLLGNRYECLALTLHAMLSTPNFLGQLGVMRKETLIL